MTAKSIMSTDVITVKPTDTVAEALMVMCENQVHNIPVLDCSACAGLPMRCCQGPPNWTPSICSWISISCRMTTTRC